MDWYPWGEEALERAREEDRPILLSIGYSACHWCHVMERESFSDENLAAFMNESFVNIKVDREERPDLDAIYMLAVQTLSGQGGWPLTAFLTPEGKVFYGGTYFPPEARHGMPSFRQVMEAVLDGYHNRREQVERGSDQLLAAIRQGPVVGGGSSVETPVEPPSGPSDLGSAVMTLDQAFRFIREQFDPVWGGFGPAPKFPQPTTLEFPLRHHRRTGEEDALRMVVHTLLAMARGGMRDHLGGGFHRYSVDQKWLVPHFEKMLYDNGLLARVYLNAYQLTGNQELLEVATSTLDYILEDLRDPRGGFYSARDADSEGEEGRFYLWTGEEILQLLDPEEAALVIKEFGVTETGNFEGRNILYRPLPEAGQEGDPNEDPEEVRARLAEPLETLRAARNGREEPFRDEKVLTGWNAFVLRALAEAGAALARDDYLQAARENAEFILSELRRDGRIHRSWKDGTARVPGFLEDYAGLGNALISLHQATLDPRWMREAEEILHLTLDLFWDEERGAFFDTPRDGETLVVRPRDIPDKATPSGHSLVVEFLLRSADLFGLEEERNRAVGILAGEEEGMERFPSAFGRLLSVLSDTLTPPVEVVILGEEGDGLRSAMRTEAMADFSPRRTVVGGAPEELPRIPILEGREMRDGKPTAYVCRDFTCSAPIHSVQALRMALESGG